jgi:broad specificity phosphatase PhoE
VPLVALVRHGQASFGTDDYDALSDVGRQQAEVVGAELVRRGLRAPEVVAGTLRRQRHTASLLMAAAAIEGRCGTDKRWDEYDHFALLRRYVEPSRIEPAWGDSRVFQELLDEALTAWAQDGGWAAFANDADAALLQFANRLPQGQDGIVVTSGGVLGALVAGLIGAPPATAVTLNRVAVNGAITTVAVGAKGASLLSFNDHAHFAGGRRALLTYR